MSARFDSIDSLAAALTEQAYFADRGLVTALFLALKLRRPLFLEGEAGVGKTELAKVVAELSGGELIRLQCYEGLDVQQAVYEWNYSRQMLHIRASEARGGSVKDADLFSEEFLLKRPLLRALDGTGGRSPLLLVDEIDRSDEEFEAYLLEVLSDYQITVPELGVIRAERPPIVIITSNRTREVHDALKRRCLYHWIDYPSFEAELRIVRAKVPDAGDRLARDVVGFVQALRDGELYKLPGIAETLDWTAALVALDRETLDPQIVEDTLGVLLKYQDDIGKVSGEPARAMLDRVQAQG